MLTIDWHFGPERWSLLVALVLLWVWLSRPALVKWAERLEEQQITLAIGGAILLNLLLVAAVPHAAALEGTSGAMLPALLRVTATLVVAGPLLIVAVRCSRRRRRGVSRG